MRIFGSGVVGVDVVGVVFVGMDIGGLNAKLDSNDGTGDGI